MTLYTINLIKKRLIDEYPVLKKVLKVNYGLLPETEDERDYVMGASPLNWKVLNPESDWRGEAVDMIHEEQKGRYIETMGCTGFALNNIEELIEIRNGYERTNRSDRFLNKMSGTGKNGNEMRRVLEARRNYGFVSEDDYPWDRDKFTWNEYYREIPQQIKDKALLNNKKYAFGYDSVWTTRSLLEEALKYSPLYVGLYAWYRNGMLYYSVSSPNHACVIINRKQFMAYDSYNPYIKNLADDFTVYFVKRIYMEKAEEGYNTQAVQAIKKAGYKYVIRPNSKGEFYKITDTGLEYIPDITVIADQISIDLKQSPADVNSMLKFLTQEKQIKWLDEVSFLKLLR
jgi:hypothetical protein